MTNEDAAELGVYAAELFRFVSPAQKHAVAEIMLPLRDVSDGRVMQPAVEVGKGILRALSASAGDEQRLHVTDVSHAVHDHMRRHGYPPPDPTPNAWKSQRAEVEAARAYEDSTHRWACELPPEEVEILTAEALKAIKPDAHFLFKNKDIRTSKTLRILAHDFYRKAHAFD